jgi:hypothetical protein
MRVRVRVWKQRLGLGENGERVEPLSQQGFGTEWFGRDLASGVYPLSKHLYPDAKGVHG